MKISIYLATIVLACVCATAYAQTSDAEADAIVNLLGVQKKDAIRQLVFVTKKDSVAFWKLYDEYHTLNKKEGKNRLRLYERTAMAYGNMTPDVADSLASKYFINRVDQEKPFGESALHKMFIHFGNLQVNKHLHFCIGI